MIRGAKAVILDPEDKMLILYRSGTHPHAAHTPDLPGGKVEENETMVEGLIREVIEETGIALTREQALLVSSHTEKKYYGNDYYLELYEVKLDTVPSVALSSEHERFEWQPCHSAHVTGELYTMLLEAYKSS